MSRSVLIVASHPDDEILGVGGTIARHADEGDMVNILIMATGATSRGESSQDPDYRAEMASLRKSAGDAARILGAREPRFAALPDNRMDELPLLDVVKTIERVVGELQPQIIYTHFGGDLNIDHRITLQAVITAARPIPGSAVTAIRCFETPSSTEWQDPNEPCFAPRLFVNIEQQFSRKINALNCYAAEMRPFPHARSLQSVEALARWRGGQAGLRAAEAFTTIREIW
jgi:N-acetylglucosamine malate deacetylase 1